MKNIRVYCYWLLIMVCLSGCFCHDSAHVSTKPVFEVRGPTRIISSGYSGFDAYAEYMLTISQVRDSVFYFSPSMDGKFYYPFGYEYVKLTAGNIAARTSVVMDRSDTVKAVILPGQPRQFYFSIPHDKVAADTLIFRFVYFDNANFDQEEVVEVSLSRH